MIFNTDIGVIGMGARVMIFELKTVKSILLFYG